MTRVGKSQDSYFSSDRLKHCWYCLYRTADPAERQYCPVMNPSKKHYLPVSCHRFDTALTRRAKVLRRLHFPGPLRFRRAISPDCAKFRRIFYQQVCHQEILYGLDGGYTITKKISIKASTSPLGLGLLFHRMGLHRASFLAAIWASLEGMCGV